MHRMEAWLELPLDGAVAKGLRAKRGGKKLHAWPGLKGLRPEVSAAYQDFAAQYAKKKRFARVHLDVYLWPENR